MSGDRKRALDAIEYQRWGYYAIDDIYSSDDKEKITETIRAALSAPEPETVTVGELTAFIHQIPGEQTWGAVVEYMRERYPNGVLIVEEKP